MSDNKEGFLLIFPWDGTLPPAETVILRDIDVVGVGAKRRQQLESLQVQKKIILRTHEDFVPSSVRKIYDEEFIRTMQWLRPMITEKATTLDILEEQKKIFSHMFPLTEKSLGLAANKVRDTYLAEMEWSSWLLQDHWRYFIGFLRQRFAQQKQLVDLAYWEWVHAWLEVQPFDLSIKPEAGLVIANPSLQIVPVLETNTTLQKAAGIYAFIFSGKENKVKESLLEAPEALLIDLIQEDRKYTIEQLADMATISEEQAAQLSKEEWRRRIESMLQQELLFLGE